MLFAIVSCTTILTIAHHNSYNPFLASIKVTISFFVDVYFFYAPAVLCFCDTLVKDYTQTIDWCGRHQSMTSWKLSPFPRSVRGCKALKD